MKCLKCGADQSNPAAPICELCGEILKSKASALGITPPALPSMPAPAGKGGASIAPSAGIPPGEAVEVEICGTQIQQPGCCCCCLGPAQETRPCTAERQNFGSKTITTWEFPYCSFCVKHAHAWYRAWLIGGIGGFCGFIALLTLHAPGMAPSATQITLSFIAGCVSMVGLWYAFKAPKGPNCGSESDAVSVSPVYGNDDKYLFHFDHGEYGRAFRDCNS